MSRRGDATRRRLLAAARELVEERGIAVPLSEVAERAGVTRVTLYRHFGPRRELMLQVLLDEMRITAEICDRLLNDPSVPLVRRMHRTMTFMSVDFRSFPLVAGVVAGTTLGELAELDPNASIHGLVAEVTRPFFNEAAAAGLLRSDIDAAVLWVGRQLVASLYALPFEQRNPQDVANEIARFFVPSLLRVADHDIDGLIGTYPLADLDPASLRPHSSPRSSTSPATATVT